MIEVKSVTKSFGDLTVLKDFSVDFNQEGVTVLLGPSGTGKSESLSEKGWPGIKSTSHAQ